MYQTSTEQLAEHVAKHEQAVAKYERDMSALDRRARAAEQKEAELVSASADVGGRPRGHATRTELESRW
eukprot:998623-Pleurochrysis_carterae.AAC.1